METNYSGVGLGEWSWLTHQATLRTGRSQQHVPRSRSLYGSMPGYADSRSHRPGWHRGGAAAMSTVASFYLLDRSAVPGLARAAKAKPVMTPAATHRWPAIGKFWSRIGCRNPTPLIMPSPVFEYLEENDLGVLGWYDWSGYVLMHLMLLLEDTGTQLGAAEYRAETEALNAGDGLTYLITSADKRHLTALDPARLDRAAAERYFDSVGDGGFEEIRQAIDDGLILLRELIAALDENEVLVIRIG
ncbi:hypothetical protein ACGFI9_36885 [Micromonospora sp. NPDC048930]|uniref:hypothetical protein n=1 Tax=Micromonospora sp. NPDC048930 TaxID=3364261 RepID=UPI00371286BF